MTTEKFLEFNGERITLIDGKGKFFIPIKPVCLALGLEYTNQYDSIKRNGLFAAEIRYLKTAAANGKQHSMLCLPEIYFYGWLCSIKSKSAGLLKYQQEAFTALYEAFHPKS